ncbi:hypothetical protein CDAR_269491 [Caerostris darwini]|uniref:Uncharacterized protein n=1 Tax=Caerostris darwini TaxID=1538125 RepID=A0AAV4VRP5_9ARAC|nr:hypothetical protein CDAR_269491 [Caerostris darwini]
MEWSVVLVTWDSLLIGGPRAGLIEWDIGLDDLCGMDPDSRLFATVTCSSSYLEELLHSDNTMVNHDTKSWQVKDHPPRIVLLYLNGNKLFSPDVYHGIDTSSLSTGM